MNRGWIGVDLDGTLAYYDKWKGPEYIGEPIKPMLDRVQKWVAEGKRVKIFTARACDPLNIPYIELWFKEVGLPPLEITNVKDFSMIELWDDRCVQVEKNTGEPSIEQISTAIVEEYEAQRSFQRRQKQLEDWNIQNNAHLDESGGELQDRAQSDAETLSPEYRAAAKERLRAYYRSRGWDDSAI